MHLTMLVLVVVTGVVFDFINGFHDTANAIATVVSTGVLRPRTAVLMAAGFNILGAFLGTAVASTIGRDIIDPAHVTQAMVLAALFSAIAWNLITWFFGIPSSSSHALVGGLIGAGFAGAVTVQGKGVWKVIAALIVSPVFGFFAALILMIGVYWVVRRIPPAKINKGFRTLQLFSSSFMALSHGTNDAQKTMGVITMALVTYHGTYDPHGSFPMPTWVILVCATAMGLGTAAGGWRIIHTMGSKIFKLRPIHGFCAETGAAIVLQVASAAGLPTSTTHCITAAVMGAGSTTRLSAVRWGVTRQIVWAWILTIPFTIALAWVIYSVMRFGGLS